VSSNSTHFDEGRGRSRGSGLARRLTDPAQLVLGASLLLPFVRTGGFGSDVLVLGPVGAWLSPGPIPPDRGAHDRQAAGISTA
jgi:hypothetical protein